MIEIDSASGLLPVRGRQRREKRIDRSPTSLGVAGSRKTPLAAEALYRDLVERLPLIVYVDALDSTSSNLYASPQTTATLGFSPDDWASDPDLFPKLLHPDDRGRVLGEHAQTLASEEPLETEYRLVGPDGRVVWIHDEGAVVFGHDGEPLYLQGYMLDITERRLREDAAAKSAARSRAMLDAALDGIVTIDHEGAVLEFNSAAEAMFGYRREDVLGRKLAELVIPPSLREAYAMRLKHFRATGEARMLGKRVEAAAMRADGSEFPVELSIVRVEVPGPPVLTAYLRDITGRKRLEERLREVSSLVESTEDAVIGTTPAAIITSWNRGAELTYGWTARETVGRSLEMIVPVATRAVVAESMRKLAVGGVTAIRHQAQGLHRDGRVIDVALTVCPVFANGALIAVSTIARDISAAVAAEAERERLLVELAQQNEQLRDFDRLKDEFVASVSHELRTPLTSIRGYLELFRDDVPLDQEHDEMLRIVDRNADRLLNLVNDLLFAAQVAAGKPLVLHVEQVDLAEIVAHAVTAAGPLAEHSGIEFQVSLQSSVIPGDAMRLAQVADNLISNAIKFTPHGGKICIAVHDEESRVVLSVSDTGIGIPEDEHAAMFTRFHRAKAATDNAIQGTGLGLAIVKATIEAHGGEITFKSQLGVGTTFEIFLPRRIEEFSSRQSSSPGSLALSKSDCEPWRQASREDALA